MGVFEEKGRGRVKRRMRGKWKKSDAADSRGKGGVEQKQEV
jgi:hypothetical protein